jgi:hypothetical protein
MPTIDDLRTVLVSREEFAGDPDTVRHHLASPPRRRVLAPTLAAATVAALAVGGVLLAASESDRQQPSGGRPESTVPPATTAPPGAGQTLDWAFSVGAVTGYQFTSIGFSAESETARITHSDTSSLAGFVTVYSPGVEPKALQLSANGQHVVVNGTNGTFLPGTEPDTVHAVDHPDSWPRLLWHYRSDAWAEIDGPFAFDDGIHMYDNGAARADELRIAEAVRIGAGGPITMPFAVTPPSELVIATTGTGSSDCLGYDLAGQPQSGSVSVLTVCRVASGRVDDMPFDSGDRVVVHDVGDGTSIVCALAAAHLDLLDQSGLQALADHVDASPKLDDPSTWLPIQ